MPEQSTQIETIKKEMEETQKRVAFWMKLVTRVILISCIVGVVALLLKQYWIAGIFISPLPITIFCFVLPGFKQYQQEERGFIEFWGKAFCIKWPGLRWVCPIFMHERAVIDAWEQDIKLYEKYKYPNGVHIDFKNGGKAELVEPILWGKVLGVGTDQEIDSILRMIYAVKNWKKACQENGENALRVYLNSLTVDEAMEAIKASNRETWWEAVKEDFPGLDDKIRGYGIEVTGLTISDFNWDSEVVAERQRIFKEERSIELAKLSVAAADDEVMQKAKELGGLHGKIVRLLMNEPNHYTKIKAMEIAETLILYDIGVRGGAITDVRGGELSPLLGSILALAKGVKKDPSAETVTA